MFVNNLVVSNFRNYESLTTQFSQRLNVLYGDNGQGKTNLIEAVLYLLNGYSFRAGKNPDFIRSGSDRSYIAARVIQNDLVFTIREAISADKREILLNKKKVSSGTLLKQFPVVVFSPDSLEAVKASAEVRRELVDNFLASSSIRGLEPVRAFKKVLRTRNKVLRDFQEKKISQKQVLDLLEAINPLFLEAATDLTFERIQLLESVQQDFNTAMKNISKNDVDISVEYVVSDRDLMGFSFVEIKENLLNRMKDLAIAELASGTSLIGPQKHDLRFLYGQKDSRIYCSQGQQRALILAFKMAQIVYHRKTHRVYPILMLDDVLSELDKEKKESLIQFLHEIKTQIFITTTDFDLPQKFQLEDISVKHVKNGMIVSG